MNKDAQAVSEEIMVKTLDDFWKEKEITRIDFLKIDTEAFEIPALEGAYEMLITGVSL
jgi:FkbM family methyltransferase